MEVGDYVRTEKGIIGKFNMVKTGETIPNWNGGYGYKEIDKEYIDNNIYNRFDDKIIKSSPNIIDLIEEHDFITIEYYSLRYDERVERIFEVDYKDNEFTTLKNAYCDFMLKNNEFNDNDKVLEPIIKSIVTKEQFESMEYKIGE